MLLSIKGLIGSGKTTCSQYLQQKHNVYHYDCDKRVKEIYKSNKDVINEINKKILNSDAPSINIETLREQAFGDKQKLIELEKIVYPVLMFEINKLIDMHDIILIDGQQVDKLEVNFDYQIYVTTSTKQIIKRVIERDNRSQEQIYQILKIQNNYEYNGDFIINNNGTKKDLYEKLDGVMEAICKKKSEK